MNFNEAYDLLLPALNKLALLLLEDIVEIKDHNISREELSANVSRDKSKLVRNLQIWTRL